MKKEENMSGVFTKFSLFMILVNQYVLCLKQQQHTDIKKNDSTLSALQRTEAYDKFIAARGWDDKFNGYGVVLTENIILTNTAPDLTNIFIEVNGDGGKKRGFVVYDKRYFPYWRKAISVKAKNTELKDFEPQNTLIKLRKKLPLSSKIVASMPLPKIRIDERAKCIVSGGVRTADQTLYEINVNTAEWEN